jgi:hypothetical protein
MPLINAETKIPQLLLDYVDSRRVALSIPDSTALPFYAGVRDSVKVTPCVVFFCEDFVMRHSERMTLSIRVEYVNDLAADDSTEESANASQVRSAVADIASWSAWLLALTTPEKEGWRVTKTRLMGGGVDIDADKAERRRFSTVQVHAITSETTFPA